MLYLLPMMTAVHDDIEKYEKLVSGFARKNRMDAALDTAAILSALLACLPVVKIVLLPAFC